ncbi:glucosyltransferase domain-containing protein [Francisella philomiragia]|uniref:glucosyltransferase domain-containing protein n=1 Tax=Francisella philomiragia TaxID=28110 RepID=UPI0019052F75|nr:glucosyltransferase domain-containing protein [Francisella philomiragia]MBK2297022.1 glucosyltransferase domain-containing protein [Francisella philomiragia]MBK2341268.1 glucosyltransferase domain-containing protein [Francisella philomiragia]
MAEIPSLLNKSLSFIQRNLIVLGVVLFFTILSYGYFITHWAVDSDSVMATFRSYNSDWIAHGRPIDALYNYLSLEQVLPFFNDFIAVSFIFISGILWLILIENCQVRLSKTLSIVFACIFIICPMYSFFLRFTLQNIFTEFSMLVCVLSAYHFSSFLNTKRFFNLISSIILCSLALMSYQTYASYFITSAVFIVLLRTIANPDEKFNVLELIYGGFVLIVALFIYKIVCFASFFITPQSDYTEQFIGWGSQPLTSIISGWKVYFHSLLSMNFNFFILLTVYFTLPFLVIINILKKRISVALLLIIFVLSPFALVFALGNGVPLRTLQAVPLMLAGVWLVFYNSFSSKAIKTIITTAIIISTLFNAQYITRLFYSDVMRLQYDKNFANRIYNNILDKTGDAIESKPLVIIGKYYHTPKPFIVHFDSIGPSFFDTDAEQSVRLHNFMSWLGNDYIMPNQTEVNEAYKVSDHMPAYPNIGYIKETKDLIVLKLADRVIVNPLPIDLNLKNLNQLSLSKIQSNIEFIKQENNGLNISGWAYIKNKDAANTKMYIRITNGYSSKIYPVNTKQRPDISRLYNDASNIQDSGWSITFTNNPLQKDSRIDLILVNGSEYIETNIPKKIQPIALNLTEYKELSYTSQRSYVDTLSYNNNILTIAGWGYMKHKDALNTKIYIKLHNADHDYIFKANRTSKNSIQELSSDTLNVKQSGFSLVNKYPLLTGRYRIFLILVNQDTYVIADTGLSINNA